MVTTVLRSALGCRYWLSAADSRMFVSGATATTAATPIAGGSDLLDRPWDRDIRRSPDPESGSAAGLAQPYPGKSVATSSMLGVSSARAPGDVWVAGGLPGPRHACCA